MFKNSSGWSGYLPRGSQALLLVLTLIAAFCSLTGKEGCVQELSLTRVGDLDYTAMQTPAP